MKINLVSYTSIPHHSAESIHIVLTAQSLGQICNLKLLSPVKLWRRSTFRKTLTNYGIKHKSFKILKFPQFYPQEYSYLKLFFNKLNDTCFYCRQGEVAEIFLGKKHNVIWEQHALPSDRNFRFLKNAIGKTEFLALIVITENLKKDIMDIIGSVHEDKIHVLSDAADVSRFDYDPVNREGEKKIGYIGSNFPGKGFEIIESLVTLCDNEFHIYGASDESPKPSVKFHGRIPYSDVPKALNTFDIGLLPNQLSVLMVDGTDIGKYTSPMKMFEYMAAGKVIIASDIPVIREILVHEHNALLVPHDDVNSWVAAIERLNNDSELFNRLKVQAYEDVVTKYSYQARARKILDIIDPAKTGQEAHLKH